MKGKYIAQMELKQPTLGTNACKDSNEYTEEYTYSYFSAHHAK